MDVSTAKSDPVSAFDKPQIVDLDRCVHCGLCLNSCPTYRELGLEMDSPRGRVYQMVQVATGQMEMGPSYLEHLDLCLAWQPHKTVPSVQLRRGQEDFIPEPVAAPAPHRDE